MDWNRLIGAILKLAILVSVAMAIAAFFSGCKTTQSTTSHEEVRWIDSVRYQTVLQYDTIHYVDTVKVEVSNEKESEENTNIQFGAGGGTYNFQTGEATNVASVSVSSREKELMKLNATLTEEVTHVTMQRDSIAEELSKYESEKDETSTPVIVKSKFDKFKSWYFWITLAIVLVVVAFKLWKRFGYGSYSGAISWIMKLFGK